MHHTNIFAIINTIAKSFERTAKFGSLEVQKGSWDWKKILLGFRKLQKTLENGIVEVACSCMFPTPCKAMENAKNPKFDKK